jgi:hypothetical protein
MIKRTEVTGGKAFEYCREQVNLSGKTLANAILNLPIENGKVYSYVPENTPTEILFRFSSGGVYPFDKSLLQSSPALVPVQNDAEPIVINTIIKYLNSNTEHCCLFEEPSGFPSDPWVEKEKIRFIHIGQEMFYFFNNDANKEEFEEIFKISQGYYFLCALSSLVQNQQSYFITYREISSENIRSFTDNLSSFFVRAYDGEGFLEWTYKK